MKKIILFISVLFLVVSCSNQESVVAEAAREADKACPKTVDFATTMDRVMYTHGDLVYNFTVNDDIIPMKDLDAKIEQLSTNIEAAMRLPQTKPLLEACKDADVDIVYNYRGSNSGRSIEVIYNPNSGKFSYRHLND